MLGFLTKPHNKFQNQITLRVLGFAAFTGGFGVKSFSKCWASPPFGGSTQPTPNETAPMIQPAQRACVLAKHDPAYQ